MTGRGQHREHEPGGGPDLGSPSAAYLHDEPEISDEEVWALYAAQNAAYQQQISDRAQAARSALAGFGRLSPAQRRSRERFVCYCTRTSKPCAIVVAYAWSAPANSPLGRAETLLLITRCGSRQRASFPEWFLDSERIDPDQWLPIACAHGRGRFPNNIPGQMINAAYTPDSGRHRRRISDLVGVAGVEWRPATPMLRR